MFLIINAVNEAISELLRECHGNCFKNILSWVLILSLKILQDANRTSPIALEKLTLVNSL